MISFFRLMKNGPIVPDQLAVPISPTLRDVVFLMTSILVTSAIYVNKGVQCSLAEWFALALLVITSIGRNTCCPLLKPLSKLVRTRTSVR